MSVLQSHQCLLLSSVSVFTLSHRNRFSLYFPPDSVSCIRSLSVYSRIQRGRVRVTAVEKIAGAREIEEEEGPIELPPVSPYSTSNSIFATNDDPTPLQVATSVLLTGAISIFLFRSLRRRAKRVKEMTFRSSGAKKSLKEEAMDNLKAMSSTQIEGKSSPSAVQAFLGAVGAGVIALILYKFTTTIEASLNRQTISDNFSVRQITVTVRTIINGICYLATFVFGINSIGLLLYSGQLAFTEDSGEDNMNTIKEQPGDSTDSSGNNSEVSQSKEDQSSGD